MAPYEALYGRSCQSPICWTEVGERPSMGSDLVRDTSEKVDWMRKRLLTAQSRQKSYADRWRRLLEFEVGDHIFLKVMPKKGVVRFGKRGKLSSRYIGPFEVLERVGEVAYRLALPPSLFECSYGIPCLHALEVHSRSDSCSGLGELVVDAYGTFEEGPVRIMDSRYQVLRRKIVRLVKVLCQYRGVEEVTWEREDTMCTDYPFLFEDEGMLFSHLIIK